MANTNIQKNKKYHIIYKITNLKNNRIYIGAHSTNEVNDGYYGSGTNITRAIKKYGISCFTKEILYFFDTPKLMFEKEKELVTVEFLKRDDVYNIVEGGYGGFNNGSKGLKHIYNPDTGERTAIHPDAISKMLKEGWIIGRNSSSTSNTIWIHKGDQKKMVNLSQLSEYIEMGWNKGLPDSPTANKVWIYNNITEEYSLCDREDLATKLSQGWVKKKWAPVKKGTCWINDGKNNLRIEREKLVDYIQLGWSKGIISNRWKS